MRRFLIFILIFLLQIPVWAARDEGSTTYASGTSTTSTAASAFDHVTVTTELLRVVSDNAKKYELMYGQEAYKNAAKNGTNAQVLNYKPGDIQLSEPPFKFKIAGKEVRYETLTFKGYEELFKASGGPFLKSIGLNFINISSPTSWSFYCYNAFLVLMIGFFWFSMIGNASKGKGLEIIPFIGKLCMGFVVCYNMPFVYATAMTLKDLGMQMVVAVMTDESAANNVIQADNKAFLDARQREEAVTTAIKKTLPYYLFDIKDYTPPAKDYTALGAYGSLAKTADDKEAAAKAADFAKNADVDSGRKRLALLVAKLNKEIDNFNKGAKAVADLASVQSGGEVSQMSITPFICHVGFNSVDANDRNNTFTNPYSGSSGTAAASSTATGAAAEAAVSGIKPTPLTLANSTIPDEVLKTVANNNEAADYLSKLYVVRLREFIQTLAFAYDDTSPKNSSSSTSYSQQITEAAQNAPANILFTYHPGRTLGTDLLPCDKARFGKTDDGKSYMESVESTTIAFLNNNFFYTLQLDTDTVPSNLKNGSSVASVIWNGIKATVLAPLRAAGRLADTAFDIIGGFFSSFAKLGLDLARRWWTPTLARFANFWFNVIIEMYVYLLWLAYPFWFYKKTEKAFTGALDTLISLAFTAMTFSLLCLFFDAFAGFCANDLRIASCSGVAAATVGGVAAGSAVASATGASGAALASGAVTAAAGASGGTLFIVGMGIAGAALTAAMVGFAIFYIVGTTIFLIKAPKIFKAFKEGSSVVTPIVMGALGAGVAGIAGGLMTAASVGGKIGKAGAAVAGSETVKDLGKKANAWAQRRAARTDAWAKANPKAAAALAKVGNFASSLASAPGRIARAPFRAASAAMDKTELGKAMKKDASAAAGAVSNSVGQFMSDPKKGLINLASSTPVKILTMAGATAMTGNPMKGLEVLAAQTLTETAFNRFGNRGGEGADSAKRNVEQTPATVSHSYGTPATAPAAPASSISGGFQGSHTAGPPTPPASNVTTVLPRTNPPAGGGNRP